MLQLGDFINDYRIITSILTTRVSNYYVVENTHSNVLPGLLVIYPSLVLTDPVEQNLYVQQAKDGVISITDLRLPIREAGIYDQYPYLILPYNPYIQQLLLDHDQLLEKVLEEEWDKTPEERAALLKNAFLATILPATVPLHTDTPPPVVEATEAATVSAGFSERSENRYTPFPPLGTMRSRNTKPVKRANKILLGLGIAVLIFLLIWGGTVLHTIIPATSATVTITPKTLKFANMYTLYVVSSNAVGPSQVEGRSLIFTSQHSETVPVTGKGTHPAKKASSTIVLSQIQLDSTAGDRQLAPSSIDAGYGITVTTDSEVDIPNGSMVRIPAHASPAGSAGNIAAHSIDGYVDLVDDLTNAKIGTGYVSNPAPFTGGTDARDYTFVQQADLDTIGKKYTDQFTKEGSGNLTKQMKAGEKLTHTPQCVPSIISNHHAHDEVADVTVKVSVTCTALAYTEQALHQAAVKEYQADGLAHYGAGFAVIGDLVSSSITTASSDGTYTTSIEGVWSYQYTLAAQQALKRLIAGKTQEDALKLLRHRVDIKGVDIKTGGGVGSALPGTINTINLVFQKVSGLKA